VKAWKDGVVLKSRHHSRLDNVMTPVGPDLELTTNLGLFLG